MSLNIREVKVKSILTRTGIPGKERFDDKKGVL